MTAPYEIVVLDVGGSALSHPFQRAGQADPEQMGGLSRAYAGNQYSSIFGEFMVVPLVSAPLTSTEFAAIKALFALGAQVDCQAGSAGNVFEGVTSVVTCSGKVTGEMIPGLVGSDNKPMWTVNLTLTEVGTALSGAVVETLVYLTNVVSPTDATKMLASTDPNDDPFGAGIGSATLLSGAVSTCGDPMAPTTAVTCTVSISAASEETWLSEPSPNGGYITGAPRVNFLSIGGTGDAWAIQDCFCKIFIVRAGVDVVEWDTEFSDGNGGFSGGTITATVASSVIFLALIGDRVRVQLYGRAAVHSGYSVGTLQTVDFGNGGAGSHLATLTWGGTVLFE